MHARSPQRTTVPNGRQGDAHDACAIAGGLERISQRRRCTRPRDGEVTFESTGRALVRLTDDRRGIGTHFAAPPPAASYETAQRSGSHRPAFAERKFAPKSGTCVNGLSLIHI